MPYSSPSYLHEVYHCGIFLIKGVRAQALSAILPEMPVTLSQRDVIDEVKTTLSSWDNCMSKNYCK